MFLSGASLLRELTGTIAHHPSWNSDREQSSTLAVNIRQFVINLQPSSLSPGPQAAPTGAAGTRRGLAWLWKWQKGSRITEATEVVASIRCAQAGGADAASRSKLVNSSATSAGRCFFAS